MMWWTMLLKREGERRKGDGCGRVPGSEVVSSQIFPDCLLYPLWHGLDFMLLFSILFFFF